RLNLKNNINEFLPLDIHSSLRYLQLVTPNLTRFTLDGPCITPPQNKLDIFSLASVFTRRLSKLRFVYISLPL
ncbi:unnamed protein product, partial [Rotaria socialis]